MQILKMRQKVFILGMTLFLCACGSGSGSQNSGGLSGNSQAVATPMKNSVPAQFQNNQYSFTYGLAVSVTPGQKLLGTTENVVFNGQSPTMAVVFCDVPITCSSDLTQAPGNCFAFYFLNGNAGSMPVDNAYTFSAAGYVNSGGGDGGLSGSINGLSSGSYSGSVNFSSNLPGGGSIINSVSANNFSVESCIP